MSKSASRSSRPYARRRRWTPDDARQALADQEDSGLSLRNFARREGLEPQRLERWRRQFSGPVATPAFVEVTPLAPAAAGGGAPPAVFEVVFPSGRLVRVPKSFDAAALRQLLEIVEAVSAC